MTRFAAEAGGRLSPPKCIQRLKQIRVIFAERQKISGVHNDRAD